MKHRTEKRIEREWKNKINWCLYSDSTSNSRWRAKHRARKAYWRAENRRFKEALKRIEKMGFQPILFYVNVNYFKRQHYFTNS